MAALLYAHLVIASRGSHVFSADQFSRFNWKKHVDGHQVVRVCMQAEFRHMHGDCAQPNLSCCMAFAKSLVVKVQNNPIGATHSQTEGLLMA